MKNLNSERMERVDGGNYAACAGALAATMSNATLGTDEAQILYDLWKSTAIGSSCYMF